MLYILDMCRICLRTDCKLKTNLDTDKSYITNEDKLIACFPDYDWDFKNYKLCFSCEKDLTCAYKFRQKVDDGERNYKRVLATLTKGHDNNAIKSILTVNVQRLEINQSKTVDKGTNTSFDKFNCNEIIELSDLSGNEYDLNDDLSNVSNLELNLESIEKDSKEHQNFGLGLDELPSPHFVSVGKTFVPVILDLKTNDQHMEECIGACTNLLKKPDVNNIINSFTEISDTRDGSNSTMNGFKASDDKLLEIHTIKKVIADKMIEQTKKSLKENSKSKVTKARVRKKRRVFNEETTIGKRRPRKGKHCIKRIENPDITAIENAKPKPSRLDEHPIIRSGKFDLLEQAKCVATRVPSPIGRPFRGFHVQEMVMTADSYFEDALKPMKKHKMKDLNTACCSGSNHSFRNCMMTFLKNLEKSRQTEQAVLKKQIKPRSVIRPYNYECDTCQKKFTSKSSLYVHIRIVHKGELRFVCSICGGKFGTSSHLKIHMDRHNGIKPYSCTKCLKSFATKSSLINHIKRHNAEKDHVCAYCNKGFVTKPELDRHIRIHTGAKPYRCNDCDKRFTTQFELVVHTRVHTGERPYKCQFCELSFKTCSNLKDHERRHLNVKLFKCEPCNEEFFTRGEQRRHEKIFHSKENDANKPSSSKI